MDTQLDPITDVNLIRCVQMQTTLTSSAALGQDETFTVEAYIRTNAASGTCSGLVGWWKLDESSGLVAADSSGNGNDGTLTGMAGDEWTTGPVEGALAFDGDNDAITGIGDCPTGNFTVACWAKETGGGSGWKTIYSAEQEIWLGVDSGASPKIWLDCGGNGNGANTAAGTWTLDTWHHIAGTWDGTTLHLYLDGVDMATTYGTPENPLAKAAVIGSWSKNTSDENWPGTIDDVRVYDIALTAEEIAALAGVVYQEFTEVKAGSDTTSVTIATPSGTSEDDLLITAVATDGDTASSLAPPGGENWNEVDTTGYASEVTLGVWWKLADASESPTHEFTWTGNETAYGWMMRFVGHDPADPVDVYAIDGEFSGTPTSPAVTTSVGNCLILRLGAFDDSDITVDSPGLSGHMAITMDSSSSAGASYEEFTEEKVASDDTKITIDTPAGTSEDDLLIAAVVTEEDTSGSLAPPGGEDWTEINLDQHDTKVTLGVWWKLAAASESSTHEFTWSGNKQAYGWIMRFTGHDTTSTIDATANGGGKSGTPESLAVTTTVANAIILRIGGFAGKDITVDAPGLSGHTAITMDEGNKCSGGAGYVTQAAIGSSGTSNFTLTKSKEYRAVTIAIAPALGGDDPVSGGAGYLRQSAVGGSGTSDFALTASQESNMLTLAIAPEFQSAGGSGGDCAEVSP